MRVANPPQMYPRVRNQGYRVDSWPEGGFPGSDFDLMREQLLDEHKVDYGILIPLHGHSFGAEAPEFAAALCHAVNEWVREAMLDRDERLHSTINIALETPELAVAEIERYAGDPRFVQVLLPTTAEYPLGNRKYWPIYAAAAEAGLPLVVHTGGLEQQWGTGWPSFYLEEHVGYANAMAAVTMSFIAEGVFAALPRPAGRAASRPASRGPGRSCGRWTPRGRPCATTCRTSTAGRPSSSASTSGSRRSRSRSPTTPSSSCRRSSSPA